MAANQPEEDAAQMRRRTGVTRVDRVFRDDRHRPHPSGGGSRGYDIILRQILVDDYRAGRTVPGTMVRSVQRWANRLCPYRMTGNLPCRELSGEYLFLLVLYKLVWPHSTYLQCIAFIANETATAKIFSERDVSLALRNLGYSMKVTSTVAYQAFTERNMMRRHLFWTEPWPVGIHGTRRRRIIDADEFGVHLNAANQKYGSSPIGLKIRKPGNYDRGTFKLTVILAVEPGDPAIQAGLIGSVENARVWARITTEPGTTAVAYRVFIQSVLNTYNAINNPAEQRTLIHDNLTAHKAPEVYEAVRVRGHRVVCRPPYRPQDGPVEFAINQVCACLTKRWSEVHNLVDMRRVIQEIIENDITGIDDTFHRCGYIFN